MIAHVAIEDDDAHDAAGRQEIAGRRVSHQGAESQGQGRAGRGRHLPDAGGLVIRLLTRGLVDQQRQLVIEAHDADRLGTG